MSGSGGRRAATTSGTRGLGVSAVVSFVLLAVAVLVVVLAGAGRLPATDRDAVGASGVPVDQRIAACPRAPAPRDAESRVLTGSAPVPGLGGGGGLRQGPLGSGDEGPGTRLERGQLDDTRTTPEDRPAVVVEAEGELAAGLFAHQVDQGGRSLAVAECAAPAADWWFAGAGATIDHSSELLISNVDPGPAVIDVRVFGPTGEVETVGTRGITIAPSEQTSIKLSDVAPQGEELTVNVQASRGRVVAAVSDSYSPGAATSGGTEWLPAQQNTRRVLQLAALPARADSRSLLVTNPSEVSEALVELEVVGETGTFTPAQTSEIRVPPGSVVSTNIGDVVSREDVALRLRSQVPVVGTVRSTAGGDTAYAGVVNALTGPAAAPLVDGSDSRVLLSAGGQAAQATVTTYTADGEQVETTKVEVPAEATTGYQPGKRAAYLLVTPDRGVVSGGVSVTGQQGLSQIPLESLLIKNREPVVRPVVQ